MKKLRGTYSQVFKHNGMEYIAHVREYATFWEGETSVADYGDDYECVTDWKDWWEDEREILSETMKEIETPDDLTLMTDRVWKIYNEINNLGDNEQVLLCRGEYYDTIPMKTLRYHIDVWSHEIAVV